MNELTSSKAGETPLDDLSGLKVPAITKRADLDELEAENIRKVIVRYFAVQPTARSAPFTVAWLRALHEQMFGEVWSWAGALRRHQTNIGPPAAQVEVQLDELCKDLRAWSESAMPLLEQAVRLHHRAVQIHPFTNGNGRWARTLANIWLRRHGSPVVEWPESTIGTDSTARGEYLDAIRAADQGDLEPLMELHRRFVGVEL